MRWHDRRVSKITAAAIAIFAMLASLLLGYASPVVATPSAQPEPVSWGDNQFGQLGDSTSEDSAVPVAADVSGPLSGMNWQAIAAGKYSTCGIADGAAFCWGDNSAGQLGIGDLATAFSAVPLQVDVSGVLSQKVLTAITVGDAHACALDSAGQAYCWGDDSSGQLGNAFSPPGSPLLDSPSPVAVLMTNIAGGVITEISAGKSHTCALNSAGQAYCWGNNAYGQLGVGSNVTYVSPGPVDTSGALTGQIVTDISAGGEFTCAIAEDSVQRAYCWGDNEFGQLGNGLTSGSTNVPGLVTGDLSFSEVGAGENFACGMASAGVFCWGLNAEGQLGNGSTTDSATPVGVDSSGALPTVDRLSVGRSHTCAQTVTGQAACWGSNGSGQLGDGTTDTSEVPVAVVTTGALGYLGGNVTQVVAGGYHTLALRTPSAPAEPTNLQATIGDGQVEIAFDSAGSGGEPITNYQYQLDGGTFTDFDPPVTGSPVTITGLTNGTEYSIKLRGVNVVGAGPASDVVTVTPVGAPSAPQNLVVAPTYTSGQLQVSFGPPASDGGSAITDYEYKATIDTQLNGTALSVAAQSDGGIVVGGDFTSPSNYLARFNSDGTPDTAFNTNVGAALNGLVRSVVVQSDGKVVVGGTFTSEVGSFPAARLARFNADGTPDTAFNTNVGTALDGAVRSVTLQPSGQIVVGGQFTAPSTSLARFNADGTPETAFNSNADLVLDDWVWSVASDTGGRIVVGGDFTGYLARFNSNGTVDGTFNAGGISGLNGAVFSVAMDEPSILVGGLFSAPSRHVARLSGSIGVPDVTFNDNVGTTFNGSAYSVVVQSDGKIMVGGTSTSPSPYLARLNFDGTADKAFNANLGSTLNEAVRSVAVQPDGTISAGGQFTSPASHLARFSSSGDFGSWVPAGTAASPVVIDGLSDGIAYDVSLRAVNSVGAGAASASVVGTPVAAVAPSAPSGLVATAGDGEVSVGFVAPADDGGAAISSYEYQLDGGSWVAFSPVVTGSPVVISGLLNAVEYSIRLRAVNVAGAGAASDAVVVVPFTSPAAPVVDGWSPTDVAGEVLVSFTAGSENGSPVTDYEYSTDGGTSWVSSGVVVSPLVVSGLTPGVDTSVVVRAVNVAGAGGVSAPVVVRSGVASAPRSVVVTPGDGGVAVSLVGPEFDGGSAVTNYEVRVRDVASGVWGAWVGFAPAVTASPLPVGGLVNGTAYEVQVRAVNAAGVGVAAEPAGPVTPSGVPDAPAGVTGVLTASPGEVVVSWTAPAGDGGVGLTGYEVSALDGDGVVAGSCVTGPVVPPAAPGTSCVVSGLALGGSYTFEVTASNAAGAVSDAGVSAAVVVAGPAGAPAGVSASPTNVSGGVSVSFAAPADAGGGTISGFEYQLDGGVWVAGGASSPLLISGLVDGQSYAVSVRAVNEFGGGVASASVVVTPRGAALAPTVSSVTAGDASAVVVFTAPTSDGGSPVTNYEYTIDGGASWVAVSPAATTSPITIAGLSNGTVYRVGLRAVTGAGAGARSGLTAVTPRTTPDAPTVSSVTPGSGQVSVVFTAPGFNGGAAVTNYEFTVDGGSSWTALSPARVTSPITITGLTNGASYEVGLRAVNPAGAGASSNLTAGVVPFGVPQPPTGVGLVAGPGAGQVTVSWSVLAVAPGGPPNDGGRVVSSYSAWVTDGVSTRACTATGASATSCVVSKLTPGVSYTVNVRARNEVGWGAFGLAAGPVVALGAASAPTVTSVTAGDASAVVVFTAPAFDGGSAISNYEYTIDGGASWVALSPAATTSPITIAGLSNGTVYRVGLRAVTGAGAGARSGLTAVTPRTTPDAPTVSSVTPGSGQVSVVFTAPGFNGGAAISNYEFTVDGGSSWTVVSPARTASPITIGGLVNGAEYQVGLRAVNPAGAGASSNLTAGVVPFGVPQPPAGVGLTAGPGAGQVTVSWSVLAVAPGGPPNDGGRVVSSYSAWVTDGVSTRACTATGASATSCVVSKLTPGVSYTVNVRARNEAGWGAFGLAAGPVAAPGAPGAPAITTVNPTGSSFAVGFTAAPAHGAAITNYQYSTDGGATWRSFSPVLTGAGPFAAIVTRTSGSPAAPLTPGATYQVRVRGINVFGVGTPTATSLVSIPKTPGAPTVTTATPTGVSGQVSVAFTAPTDPGVPALTSYEYTVDNGATWAAAAGTTSPILIDGLVDGTEYQVGVRAVNAAGVGAGSNTVPVTPRTAPTAPQSLAAAPNEIGGQLEVTFTAPAGDGGSPVTTYEYRLDSGTWVSAGTTTSPFVIDGLTNGTAYAVELRAVNAAGPGAAVGPVSATPRTAPGAPENLDAAPNEVSGELAVSFTAPTDNGGATITDYQYRVDGGTWTATGSTTSPFVITGLTNGTDYQVELRAVNAAGDGTPAGPVTGTPRTTPGVVGNLTATHGNAQARLSFTAPTDDGGDTITGYEYSTDAGATWAPLVTTRSVSLSATITTTSAGTPLVNGTEYTVEVTALNVAGRGTASSTTVTPSTLPSAPAAPTNTAGDGQLVVTWTAPDDGGATITRYQAFAIDSTGAPAGSCIIDGTPAATSCTITGLDNGEAYTTTVRARNLNGQSPSSPASQPTTPQPPPQ